MNESYKSLDEVLYFQKTNYPGYMIIEKKETRGKQLYDRYKIVDIVKDISVKKNAYESMESNGIIFIEMKHD